MAEQVKHKPQVGDVVSFGTLRPSQVFLSMYSALEYYAPEKAARLLKRDDYEFVLFIIDHKGCDYLEKVAKRYAEIAATLDKLIQEVFFELENLAPEGAYFGAHWGDGALFGFWPTEEEETVNSK